MTATNHALTGSIIGLSIANPLIALPLAFASHYALDALPHGGSSKKSAAALRSLNFKVILVLDILLCVGLALLIASRQPASWALAVLCAFIATSPDSMWIKDFIAAQKSKPLPKHKNIFVVLHSKMQWFQKPIGSFVEIAWFITAVLVIVTILG